jgi:Uma2 family endonuclease
MSSILKKRPASDKPEPTWEIAHLFPAQGHWSEAEYLSLDTNRRVEFSNGFLKVLSVPTIPHQLLAAYFYSLLQAFVARDNLGMVLFAGVRVRIWRDNFREPDVAFMRRKNFGRVHKEYWEGADLVMEA